MKPVQLVPNRYPHKLAIVNLVKDSRPGDTFTVAQIDAACGATRDVWKHALSGAKKDLRRSHGIVLEYDRVTKLYRHVKAKEKSGLADRRAGRARRQVREGLEIVSSVSDEAFTELSPGEQTVQIQTKARLGLFHDMMSTPGKVDRAIAANSRERPRLPK